jgi:hypothetical protein
MTEPELRKTVLETLSDIAPEADLGSVPSDEHLREELGHRLDGFPELRDRAARKTRRRYPDTDCLQARIGGTQVPA